MNRVLFVWWIVTRSQIISVLLPVYNGSLFLSLAIESVIRQTYSRWELLVVNDGSTDDTADVAERFSRIDNRVRVFSQENGGICAALNYGLAQARGEFIARMDSDDICYPDRFANQLAYLNEINADLIGSQVDLIDPAGRKLVRVDKPLHHDEIEGRLLKGDGSAIIHPTMFCRRSTLEKVNGYREEALWIEDLDLYLRVAEIGKLGNVDQSLLAYRQHPASINHTKADQQIDCRKVVMQDACSRRGLSFESDVAMHLGANETPLMEWHERYRRWAWKALLVEGDRRRGFDLLCQATKLDPWNRGNLSILRSVVKSFFLPRQSW